MSTTTRATWDAAFRRTTYRASAPDTSINIRIGESPRGIRAENWAFVTACNPLPHQLTEAENQTRHQELVGFLTEIGLC